MYAIIDIETTGGSPKTEKITEIAIYKFDGEKIIDSYNTLINPEKKIPYYITQLTGISNSMVAEAPKFYEIAKHLVEFTEGCVFVAHNTSFDYGFIREEYKRLGYNFSLEKLCTVSLSRKLIPGYPSYSLGKICANLGIEIKSRHRADGDAFATVQLFSKLLQQNNADKYIAGADIGKKILNEYIDPKIVKELPEEAGVYYFFDVDGNLIYVGKSTNIKQRVLQHFRNDKTKKAFEMKENIAEISYELTGNNLIAELKESAEIKQFLPKYNRQQRRTTSKYGLYDYTNNDGYICFTVATIQSKTMLPLQVFTNLSSARGYLNNIIEKYHLCQKLCGLYQSESSCFHYEIRECNGACIGEEPVSEYNQRVNQFLATMQTGRKSFYIIENGRSHDEIAVIKIEQGVYKGFGYKITEYINNNEELGNCISNQSDNRDTQQIINRYLHEGKPKDIVYF